MNQVTPIRDQVAIKPDEAEKTAAGYIIPDSAQKKPKRGTVVAVGPGAHANDTGVLIPMQVRVGDVVYYSKYAGTEVEDLIVLRENEILIIV